MAKVSAKTREELVQAVGERYRHAESRAKGRILDEFVQLTGFHVSGHHGGGARGRRHCDVRA
jgi:hypothetical protein